MTSMIIGNYLQKIRRNTFDFLSTLDTDKKVFYVVDIPELGLTERQCDVNGKILNFKNFNFVLKKPNSKIVLLRKKNIKKFNE